ncbi:PIN domain-containing protein [Crucibulum laeve]|uniref:PIN domain-containing protein n=1 Tax=Crucibulum laeve TaxID=68775 RepID=A0A5C3MFM0_9AGAR|nr:PIN domain-containing protein [Crucibulum laeve]
MSFHTYVPSAGFNSWPTYGTGPVPAQTPHALGTNTSSHLNTALKQIDELSNDVEMQDAASDSSVYVIVDTNILLHHFEVLSQFVEDVERLSVPLTVVIPGAVINELDGQKNRDGLAWFARRASSWLLKKIREKKCVRGQANEQTRKKSGNWKVRDKLTMETNDDLIVDCCMYFFARHHRTFLCSQDTNLLIHCLSGYDETLPTPETICPLPKWSSREIARVMYPNASEKDLNHFSSYRASYSKNIRSSPASKPAAVSTGGDDSMMIDDDEPVEEALLPSHELDLLHIQVIEHFTRLLVELVNRVGGDEVRTPVKEGVNLSRHAPVWQQKRIPVSRWSAADCLEYLASKKKPPHSSPSVGTFLTMPYKTETGSRRGQDWSRRDWEVALATLEKIGEAWGEDSIKESLVVLQPHWVDIFMMKMKPTGI